MEFFFWKRDDTQPNRLIYSPHTDSNNGASATSPDAPSSPSGILATPDSEYPLSIGYDFTHYTFEPSEPSPPESPWDGIEGINEWVDLGNTPPNQQD